MKRIALLLLTLTLISQLDAQFSLRDIDSLFNIHQLKASFKKECQLDSLIKNQVSSEDKAINIKPYGNIDITKGILSNGNLFEMVYFNTYHCGYFIEISSFEQYDIGVVYWLDDNRKSVSSKDKTDWGYSSLNSLYFHDKKRNYRLILNYSGGITNAVYSYHPLVSETYYDYNIKYWPRLSFYLLDDNYIINLRAYADDTHTQDYSIISIVEERLIYKCNRMVINFETEFNDYIKQVQTWDKCKSERSSKSRLIRIFFSLY